MSVSNQSLRFILSLRLYSSFITSRPRVKNNKQDLLMTTLDTQKAFDVVDHNSLLSRLYLDGIHGDDWLVATDARYVY